ncbi:atrial natriuretic peptide-converting enzyme-like [Dreissena polymorpha]|uniref:Uncharacterized protein n=1 Tax=Dreissena polymorpha TaxID=45954 RepID=A0A9D4ID91_DREPO|nr:atrial natriuretic peptide-converting enzyme-like [Dreissena polymorpha]KAH3769249.1 hypothetical protein DPMN_170499 [Dreissena polymorpha]
MAVNAMVTTTHVIVSIYCDDESDESTAVCGEMYLIPCDFEDAAACGYDLINPNDLFANPDGQWRRRGGYAHQIPPYDKTFGDDRGHFAHFSEWLVHSSSFAPHTGHLSSPRETFNTDGCIQFWYYLNGTATQPDALSAQIYVRLLYSNGVTELRWYDQVNRKIDTWIQGGVPVRGNQEVYLKITAIVSEPPTAWPGTVAVDDISYQVGACRIVQSCTSSMFMCADRSVCIPQTFVCNGNWECLDGTDEANCARRPNGAIELSGGDGTYGEVRYFMGGMWKEVCYPSSNATAIAVSNTICELDGFVGRVEAYRISRYTYGSTVQLSCSNGSCTAYSYSCSTTLGVRCSNYACFSGERLCSGTVNTCVPNTRFCDGLPDCPDNTDEMECFCDMDAVDDNRCRKTFDECIDKQCQTCTDQNKFECMNHECVLKSQRCDGIKHCSDGSDEYRCAIVETNMVYLPHNGVMKPVCMNDVNRQMAESVCNFAGKGTIVAGGIKYGRAEISDGLHVVPSTNGSSVVRGIRIARANQRCYPLVLECSMPECGSPVYLENFISPLVMNGRDAQPGEWPWQISLRYNNRHICGGTYIGRKWVLTAYHCIESTGSFYVRFGVTMAEVLENYSQEIDVSRIHRHPDFDTGSNGFTNGSDLALLEMAYEPMTDNYTRPVCLGNAKSYTDIIDKGEMAECYITGFGKQETDFFQVQENRHLKESKVHVVDPQLCDNLMYFQLNKSYVADDALCLENREPYAPSNDGDSGGPMVCKDENGRFKQFGVTSWGLRDSDKNAPAIYVNIIYHQEWIESITGIPLT